MIEGNIIGIIGVGNMGEAILRGLHKKKIGGIIISEKNDVRRDYIQRMYQVDSASDNLELAARADIIILAVKPQDAKVVLEELCPRMDESKLLISLAAGITIQHVCSFLGTEARLIRAMPNMAAIVLESATALTRGGSASEQDVDTARELFDSLGRTVVLQEALMDAVTGLSGSGPAYVALFVEALADGGVRMGLPRQEALDLAAQTVLGTARLLLETGEHPAVLKDRVASPGGTTIAALSVLEHQGFRGTVIEAVIASAERARELSMA